MFTEARKRSQWNLVYLALAGILFLPAAKADIIYDFSIDFTSGNHLGTLTGTLDLPFVNAGGSGSGAASSIVLTSIPSGFSSLLEGSVVTNWTNQDINSFSVTNGVITSFAFMAVTGSSTSSDDGFFLNSTATASSSFGFWHLPADVNELSTTNVVFGFNSAGLSGVTFSAVPEPSSLSLFFAGLFGLGVFCVIRKNTGSSKSV